MRSMASFLVSMCDHEVATNHDFDLVFESHS
mgnify:CR=1 FL=1